MSKSKLVRVAEGIYRHVNKDGKKGSYFERVLVDRRNTFVKLAASREREAVDARAANRAQYAQWLRGVSGVRNPYESFIGRDAELFKIIDAYKKAGCPRRSQKKARAEATREQVVYSLDMVCRWPGWNHQAVEHIDARILTRYGVWRREHGKKISNGRTIDLELAYLSGALRWAVWQGLISRNPLAGIERPSFQNAATRHCRDARVKDAVELHEVTRELFLAEESEVLGWQFAFECFSGLRTSETLRLRKDAEQGKPGYIDGDILYVKRSKDGIEPYVKIHPALCELLIAHSAWKEFRFPHSPWFFPSPIHPQMPVGKGALAQALRRKFKGKRLTSHGARAYYVTALDALTSNRARPYRLPMDRSPPRSAT
jgi:integrase